MKNDRIIAACGNNCAVCPRYTQPPYGKTEAQLHHTAELWMRIGYRKQIESNEALACSGCKPANWCRYGIIQCTDEKHLNHCGECRNYPCSRIQDCLEVTMSFEPACRNRCTPEEYEQISQAFFHKRDNLAPKCCGNNAFMSPRI